MNYLLKNILLYYVIPIIIMVYLYRNRYNQNTIGERIEYLIKRPKKGSAHYEVYQKKKRGEVVPNDGAYVHIRNTRTGKWRSIPEKHRGA